MAHFLSGEEIAALLSGTIHLPKQIEPSSVHLTAGKVFQPTSSGAVDFGGSEYSEAEREAIAPKKLAPEDKYGWWDLPQGTYILELNESLSLPEDTIGLLVPSRRITQSGASHPAQLLTGQCESIVVPLFVPSVGIRIKQNARVSQLLVIYTT